MLFRNKEKQLEKEQEKLFKYGNYHGGYSLEYKGGIPSLKKEATLDVSVYDKGLLIHFASVEFAFITFHSIVDLHMETTEQIGQRLTATRIATLGIFALAFKKKTKDVQKFLTIDFKNEAGLSSTAVFGGKKVPDEYSLIYDCYSNFLIAKESE